MAGGLGASETPMSLAPPVICTHGQVPYIPVHFIFSFTGSLTKYWQQKLDKWNVRI